MLKKYKKIDIKFYEDALVKTGQHQFKPISDYKKNILKN